MKKIISFLLLTILFCNTTFVWAQDEDEPITYSEKFQEAYYDALKEKAIENYDNAIVFLDKCLKMQPENPIIHHELGKNYFSQKDYINSENAFIKATEIDTKNKWYLIDLYNLYYITKNYNQALVTVQKIVPLDKEYREDLTSLYMYTQQFDKALVLINELDETKGKTEQRDRFRLQIQAGSKNKSSEKNELENAIEKNPINEENYLSLIYSYYDNNQEEKALKIAQKLEKNIPESQWAQVFLFKNYINSNDGNSAATSLDKVLSGTKIDKKIKHKMFNEFLIFTQKNPTFEPQLNKAISYFENDKEVNVFKELGKFYFKKKDWKNALINFEKSKDNTDLEANKYQLYSYSETADFKKLQTKASDLIDTFPNQPEYYFFAGKASFELKNFKNANDFLESGLEFVVNNQNLEFDFLMLLSQSNKEAGNQPKSDLFLSKATSLKAKQKQ
jgi:predicted Zn-dependent protease